MVSLPRRGPRTGSRVSSMFSMRTTSPAARALSTSSRQLSVATHQDDITKEHKRREPPLINRLFDCSVSPPLTHADDPQLFAVFVFDPFNALQLRIHHERPTLAGSQDGGVLRRHPVGGQPFVLPCCDVGIVCQHSKGVQVRCRWNWDLAGKTSSGFTMTGSKSPLGFVYI